MARQTVAGSIRSRKAIAIYPDPAELQSIQHLADQWQCSLGQAAMRLVRTGLSNPESRQLSDRVQQVYVRLSQSHSRDQIHEFTSAAWGLNCQQTDQLLAEARAMLEKDCEMARPAFLGELLDRLKQYESQAAKRGLSIKAIDAVRQQVAAETEAAAHQSSSTPVKSSSSC